MTRETALESKPLYRYSAAHRVASARLYLNQQVRVIEHPGRWADRARVIAGQLISVTCSPTSNGAELIVVRVPGEILDTAISLSNVARIKMHKECSAPGAGVQPTPGT